MAPLRSCRLRFVISVALAAALSFVTVGCGTILGIEDVKEIQRSGTGGTGGATATAGTGGGTGGATCQPETCDSRGWQCGTGATYLPLDPAYPEERLKLRLQNSEVQFVITEETLKSRLHREKAPAAAEN